MLTIYLSTLVHNALIREVHSCIIVFFFFSSGVCGSFLVVKGYSYEKHKLLLGFSFILHYLAMVCVVNRESSRDISDCLTSVFSF